MDLKSVRDWPVGCRANILVDSAEKVGEFVHGLEVPFGERVAFKFEGSLSEHMTLYNVTKSSGKLDQAWVVKLDPDLPPLSSRLPHALDFGYAHDVLCGLGGFSTASAFLGLRVVSAIDWTSLALDAYQLNHDTPVIRSDIGSSSALYRMHWYQNQLGCQPLVLAGTPCQALSFQGHQRREADERSATLPAVLRAAAFLRAIGLLLECVPAAQDDPSTQAALREFAALFGYTIHQKVLHLQSVWPCRRSRWFALIIHRDFEFAGLDSLPELNPAPVLGDLFPFTPWPIWSPIDEAQLRWTDLECQVFRDPAFGPTDRKLDMQAPCPTALHTWGSVTTACPCGCRKQGISLASLLRKGLRGVEVRSGAWPHLARHIHPRELQLILGFPPFEDILPDCRAQLALFGNSVSPVQVLWILGHLLHSHDMTPAAKTPRELLAGFLTMIVKQRDLTWPNPDAGVMNLTVRYQGVCTEVSFNTSQTVQDLLHAEGLLHNSVRGQVLCEGFALPPWSFLQERVYEVSLQTRDSTTGPFVVPLVLEYLGVRSFRLAPLGMSYSVFLKCCGILDFLCLVDECGLEIQSSHCVAPWKTVVVQLSPEDLDFELSLRLDGLGLDQPIATHSSLIMSQSFVGTGLWQLDQLVRSDLLPTWACFSFSPFVCWLPSLAAAVVELWPSTIDEHLRGWLAADQAVIYAIVWESQAWNLVRFELGHGLLRVTHFAYEHEVSCAASFLAFKVKGLANRDTCTELFCPPVMPSSAIGSLPHALEQLDLALGIPGHLVEALRKTRDRRHSSDLSTLTVTEDVSPTWPCEPLDFQQMPFPPNGLSVTMQHLGLTVRFVLDFAKALSACAIPALRGDQVKVVCLGALQSLPSTCELRNLTICHISTWIFVLVNHHWTLVSFRLEGSTLKVVQYDGLGKTSLLDLAPLTLFVKSALQASHVHASTTWTFPQTRPDSCGTLALAHFASQVGAITYEQAVNFEALHDSLAVCSSLLRYQGPTGFGSDETAITQMLAQILPSKGVPVDEVAGRAAAAIKTFGTKPLQQALQSKNPWVALKSLGNSRPKPFLWVLHHELQVHIQERAQGKFGAVDVKRRSKKAGRSEPAQPRHVDPASLVLPAGLFITNCGTPLPQLQIEDVQKDARGVAFATASDAQHFLLDGKMISPDGLALLVVGPLPEHTSASLPMHSLRVPAIYKGTNEPVIIDCVSIQLGDLAVYRKQNQAAPEIAVVPTRVLRAHVFKDLFDHDWHEFTEHPVRLLVQAFPVFRLCRTSDCEQDCGCFHPSLEEEGAESGLLDIWAFRWHGHDGAKHPPAESDVLSVYLRVPESSFDQLHRASGTHGCFFEPRCDDQPGPDTQFAVIWLPQSSLADVMHRVRTVDRCLAVCRLGQKYGIRCLEKHQEELHQALCPNKPFVSCAVKAVYRLEPLPVGTQRASLVSTLQAFGWNAKPLQPCKGSQGRAWQVGAGTAPPHQFIEAQHGWIGITKVKDAAPVPQSQGLIATSRTKQHIQEASSQSASSHSNADPWLQGSDPWSGYQPSKSAARPNVVPSQHVQSRFDDVESRLQEHVKSTMTQELHKFQESSAIDGRITAVENQLQTLVDHQSKLEHWVADGSSKVLSLQQDCQSLHHTVQSQGQTLQTVVQEVSQCSSGLQSVAQEVTGRPGPSPVFKRAPGSRSVVPRWILHLWTLVALFFTQCCRIGEASVPGPPHEPDSFTDPPVWTLQGSPDFTLGLFNPSGISNKFHMLDFMPHGWWHVAETQASKYQQCAFQGYLRSLSSRSGRFLRSTVGAPAALRPGSQSAGHWTGVLTFGDCPLKHVPVAWPSGEFESGRVLLTAAVIHSLEVVAATVYLPPRGPTYPNAVALSEALLAPITAELVLGRSGCRAILGDMNCPAGSLHHMAIWQAEGWVELQDLMSAKYGVPKQATCKASTSPDQIWLSPELASLVCNVALWGVFPDHQAVLAGLRLPEARVSEFQWRLPGHVPWDKVCSDKWISSPDLGPLFQSNPSHEGRSGLAGVHDGRCPYSTVGAPVSDETQLTIRLLTTVALNDGGLANPTWLTQGNR
eukprot:s158_g15.t1